jgi:3'-phosphoadenosine 5'-phosphosulfate sulfotransferase (PAPS reductase)/FAD synthetase
VPEDRVLKALGMLVPTGNPFLDLCLWKGRFPSTKARFCSEELKRNPIVEAQIELLDAGNEIWSWQGVRADESLARRDLPELDEVGGGLWNYRPILKWTADDCFAMHKKHGIKHNPLYEQGMGRVGCMPCIHARKDELLEISKRFPEEVERVARWERLVSAASKRGSSTFGVGVDVSVSSIHSVIEWAKTSHGGKQYDFLRMEEGPSCSSIYGLCE